VVIVDDAPEDISSNYWTFCAPFRSCHSHRKALTKPLVWTIIIVVFTIFFENAAKMVFIQDQDMIQALFTN
jgi:hypothetical protein